MAFTGEALITIVSRRKEMVADNFHTVFYLFVYDRRCHYFSKLLSFFFRNNNQLRADVKLCGYSMGFCGLISSILIPNVLSTIEVTSVFISIHSTPLPYE